MHTKLRFQIVHDLRPIFLMVWHLVYWLLEENHVVCMVVRIHIHVRKKNDYLLEFYFNVSLTENPSGMSSAGKVEHRLL